jgi:TPR repeat protein
MKNYLAKFCAAFCLVASVSAALASPMDDYRSEYAKKNYTAAFKIIKPMAVKGEARAQSNLGVMYGNGHGVVKDYKEAVKWYRLAAEQGNAIAQSNLGFMYDNGQGVAQDHKEAVITLVSCTPKA